MTRRADAMQYFHAAACAVLGSEHCYPAVQPASAENAPSFPSIVYRAVGQKILATQDAGPHQTGTAIRYELRSPKYDETLTLDKNLLHALRASARLVGLLSLEEDFDDELAIHRRMRSVMVR